MKKWVFITGGTRGIGKAIVDRLSQDYKVIFTYKKSEDRAKEIVTSMQKEGLDVQSYKCDSSDSNSISQLCTYLVQEYGAPYAVINNSGINIDQLFINTTENSIFSLFENNLFPTLNITRAFLPSMMENSEGRIINISSIASIKGNIGQTGYSSTKSALNGLVKSLSLEVARFNVTVNNILPGFIESDMTDKIENKMSLKKTIPLRKFGKPENISGLVSYLLSRDSDYITGQNLIVDGGLSC